MDRSHLFGQVHVQLKSAILIKIDQGHKASR